MGGGDSASSCAMATDPRAPSRNLRDWRLRERLLKGWHARTALSAVGINRIATVSTKWSALRSATFLRDPGELVVAGGVTNLISQCQRYGSGVPCDGNRLDLITETVGDDDMAAWLASCPGDLVAHHPRAAARTEDRGSPAHRPADRRREGYAFRGVEEFAALPRVHLCDTAAEFQPPCNVS